MTDDRSLINAILSGNPDAFETIMNRYKNKVFGMIYALTGDKEVTRDFSQEVFVKIYNNLEQFNPDLSLAGWVYRIARNTAFDYLRKNRHVTHFPFDELELLIKYSFNNDEFLDDSFNAGVWGTVDRLKYNPRPVETRGFLARLRQKRKRLAAITAILALVIGFTLFRQPIVTALY